MAPREGTPGIKSKDWLQILLKNKWKYPKTSNFFCFNTWRSRQNLCIQNRCSVVLYTRVSQSQINDSRLSYPLDSQNSTISAIVISEFLQLQKRVSLFTRRCQIFCDAAGVPFHCVLRSIFSDSIGCKR